MPIPYQQQVADGQCFDLGFPIGCGDQGSGGKANRQRIGDERDITDLVRRREIHAISRGRRDQR